ncbi:TPA: hypothetical protein ACX3KD_005598 [Raoultella ornithinolytica]
MNIETVNELIASLESAGDLSIKERKYLELAKEFRICSASLDAAIKTGNVLADQNAQLAAENVGLKNRTQQLIDIINNADNAYCMCGDAMKSHTHGGCGHPTGMFDYHYGKWLEHGNETPATDRIVAGIKADGVEEFAAHLRANDNGASVCKMIALGADDFAQQLREGADK